jgi:serine/threonine-protein kinase
MTVSTFARRQAYIGQPAVARVSPLGTVLPALNHACVTLGHVHMRVLAGVGAWLLGVGAATAGSLLAVSLLGQGIAASTSQQLTSAAVNNALAAEASEKQGADSATTGSPDPSPSATQSDQAQPYRRQPQTGATPPGKNAARASRSRPASLPGAQATATATPSSTVLTSVGGTVVADCRPAGAYLVSWSPTPGYEIGLVARGPASIAHVAFSSAANSVTMMVSCSAGVPTVSNVVHNPGSGSGSGGSGDGGGGDELGGDE